MNAVTEKLGGGGIVKRPARCTHARSEMTPCVLRDGPVCYAMNAADQPICVGCERSPAALGLDPPPDWGATVAAYHKKQGRR